MLLSGGLVLFHTLTFATLVCMSYFLTFSYLENACKKAGKRLKVGNGLKESKTQPTLSLYAALPSTERSCDLRIVTVPARREHRCYQYAASGWHLSSNYWSPGCRGFAKAVHILGISELIGR